jgi:DNA-3-methyladenine glycosylase
MKYAAKYLDQTFFVQKTLKAAKKLVGCYLVRKIGKKIYRIKITETEAYIGPHDLACHSAKGRTKRTEIMYAEPGTIYIYIIYGVYFMLNIVTEKKDFPAAILIRGAGEWVGPGRLAKALEIDKKLNGLKAVPENGLWFEPRDEDFKGKIKKSKRIGIDYAGPIWADKEYRFILADY